MPTSYDNAKTLFLEDDQGNRLRDVLKFATGDDRLVVVNLHDADHKDPRILYSLGMVQTSPCA